MREFQEGKHEGSVISVATIRSISLDEQRTWREIRKELETIGISVDAFNDNKVFILRWLQHAIESGSFEEQDCPVEVEPQRNISFGRKNPIQIHILEGQNQESLDVVRRKPKSRLLKLLQGVISDDRAFKNACSNKKSRCSHHSVAVIKRS